MFYLIVSSHTVQYSYNKRKICDRARAERKAVFAKPFHSWERGQNENANGLLRQYFPKSMKLHGVSIKHVFQAVHKLNNRPRKCLGFKTPYEVFQQLTNFNIKLFMDVALHLNPPSPRIR